MKRIVLSISTSGQVYATFEGEPMVAKLFGTDKIPTPFTFNHVSKDEVEMYAAIVLREIQVRNTGFEVMWSPEVAREFAAHAGVPN